MSGGAGGTIIGGIIALVIAPYVIAGAAAIGLAYGALKVGSYLIKHAVNYAAERKREKELVVNQCSPQLEALYSKMRGVVSEETEAHVEYANKMADKFQEMGEELKQMQKERPSAEELDKKIASAREELERQFGEQSEQTRREIIDNGNKNMSKCIEIIEESMREKAELEIWHQTTVAAESMQKNTAEDMLRDAKASVEMLENMGKSTRDAAFREQVLTMRRTYENAKSLFDMNVYQGAFSSARTVIRKSAILASEHVQQEMEMDLLEMELRARLEGLREEMISRRIIEFRNEGRKDKKLTKADLHAFSQGKYVKMLEYIDAELKELEKHSGNFSLYEMQKMTEQFERETEPDARFIMERSLKIMQGYYERLNVLDVVKKFMEEQNYKMDWAAPVGGDVSQKLVVHFTRKSSENTVSITLDNDVTSDDIANMAIEVLTFYDSGREVTEEEKKELRDDLTHALHEAGIEGSIRCTGDVGQSSSQVEMNQKEEVKKLQTKTLV